MRKLILASAALVGLTGAALAQEAPALIYSGAYAQNVQNAAEGFGLDYSGTASIGVASQDASPVTALFDEGANEIRSGR